MESKQIYVSKLNYDDTLNFFKELVINNDQNRLFELYMNESLKCLASFMPVSMHYYLKERNELSNEMFFIYEIIY